MPEGDVEQFKPSFKTSKGIIIISFNLDCFNPKLRICWRKVTFPKPGFPAPNNLTGVPLNICSNFNLKSRNLPRGAPPKQAPNPPRHFAPRQPNSHQAQPELAGPKHQAIPE